MSPPLHRKEEETVATLTLACRYNADGFDKTGCQDAETNLRKRRLLFAGFVARVGNERVPKRMLFGEV